MSLTQTLCGPKGLLGLDCLFYFMGQDASVLRFRARCWTPVRENTTEVYLWLLWVTSIPVAPSLEKVT